MSSGLWFLPVMKNDDVTMWTKLSKDVRIMRFNNKNQRQSHSQAGGQQWLASTKLAQNWHKNSTKISNCVWGNLNRFRFICCMINS